MALQPDNPVARLFNILQSFKGLGGGGHTKQQVGKVFGLANTSMPLEKIDTVAIVVKVLNVVKLAEEAEDCLHKIEGLNKGLYLRAFPQIRQTLNLMLGSMDTAWDTCHQSLKNIEFTALEFAADQLSKHPLEQLIDDEELKTVQAEIDSVYDSVSKSELNKELKHLILDQLELIRRALHEYKLRGAKRLREAFAESLGNLFLEGPLLKESKDEPEVNLFWKVYAKFGSLVSFANKAAPYVELVGKILPMLGSGQQK
ncbi:MAG TPA: hypothetical protein VNH22_10105 [Blastocatellia bacterium]|jgi:hypothetical protein|nr:hypothetical protein [Blastocatellia bacterium]